MDGTGYREVPLISTLHEQITVTGTATDLSRIAGFTAEVRGFLAVIEVKSTTGITGKTQVGPPLMYVLRAPGSFPQANRATAHRSLDDGPDASVGLASNVAAGHLRQLAVRRLCRSTRRSNHRRPPGSAPSRNCWHHWPGIEQPLSIHAELPSFSSDSWCRAEPPFPAAHSHSGKGRDLNN